MNRSIVGTALCCALLLPACQENREEDAQKPLSEVEYYKTIGEEIPFETAMEWIEYYRWTEYNNNKSAGGKVEVLADYVVSESQMDAVLESTANLTGVAFHWGIDELGQKHIILIPIDETLSVWSSTSGRVFVDANSDTQISQSVASTWAQNYKNLHPNEVWFHFFGKNIFDDMRALPYFNSVDIEPGINTLDLTPEMLLVVWNETDISLGRTAAQEATVYDASNACPPCATQ